MCENEIAPERKPGRPKQYEWVLSVAFPAELKRLIQAEAAREEVAFAEVVRILVRAGAKARNASAAEFEVAS